MSLDTRTNFIIGYGGWAKIKFYRLSDKKENSWIFVPLLSGSLSKSKNVSFNTSYHIPFSDKPRSQIRINDGIITFSGNISFQLTKNLKNVIFELCSQTNPNDFFSRTGMFDIYLCDGMKKVLVEQCVWNNFQFSVSPNSTLQCSLSFKTTNKHQEEYQIQRYIGTESDIPKVEENDKLQQFWNYGNSETRYDGKENVTACIQNFSLSFSRNVQQIFLNNDYRMPTYLRVGILDCSMNITCLQDWWDYTAIRLNDRFIYFLNSYKQSQNWQIQGNNGQGVKSYNIRGTNVSTSQVFKIES